MGQDPDAEAFDFGDTEKWATDYSQSRTTIDAKGLKAAYPDIYEQFARRSQSRVLRVCNRPKGAKERA